MSWLNARARDNVELRMEKELWSKARAFVEESQQQKGRPVDDEANNETTVEDHGSGGRNVPQMTGEIVIALEGYLY